MMHNETDTGADMQTRTFDIGDYLSAVHGRVLSRRGMDGVYEILGWAVGDENIMTHAIPAASRKVSGPLADQHPELAAEKVPTDIFGNEDLNRWLDRVARTYGQTVELSRV